MPRDAASQIQELKETFSSTEQISRAANGTLFRVKHVVQVKPETNYRITLFVTVPIDFPRSPPYITTSDGEHHVPITKPTLQANQGAFVATGNEPNNNVANVIGVTNQGANANSRAAYDDSSIINKNNKNINTNAKESWNSEVNTLCEAVMNAFQRVALWWGDVQPPTIDSALQELNKQSDDLLSDLVNNSNCLDAYCYQLPIVKEIRNATQQTLNKLEDAASTAITLQKDVTRLEKEVQELKELLSKQVEQMHQLNNSSLMQSVATPEALLRTLAADVLSLEKDCKACGREALDLFGQDRRAFQDKLNAYKQLCKRKHILNLKRSRFSAQLSESKSQVK